MEFHGTFEPGVGISFHSMEFGVGATSTIEILKFRKIHVIQWNIPYDLETLHGIPWNSMEQWNIDINKLFN